MYVKYLCKNECGIEVGVGGGDEVSKTVEYFVMRS